MADTRATGPGDRLTRREGRTLALAALGGALEFYDFIVFVYFTGVISRLFFPPDMPEWLRQFQTLGIFAVGYLARPLGGIVLSHFGDRIGRKRMFTLSVFLMAVPTLAIGLLPTYAMIGVGAPLLLLALRLLQGAAIGGEVPGAWVFVSEHVPRHRVGIACATLTAGLTAGIVLGSLTATLINLLLAPPAVDRWGWRVPFLLGGAFGLFAMYLRRWLHETPVFEAIRARQALSAALPLKTVLQAHLRAVAVSMLLSWVLTAGIVVVVLLTPALLQQLHGFDAGTTLRANTLATVCLTVGCVGMGWLCDRFGAARAFAGGCAAMGLLGYLLYLGVAARPAALVPLYALAGLGVGAIAAVPAIMVGLFPAEVRFSGLSFSYNVAYAIFGGMTPLIVAILMRHSALAPAHYVGALSLLGIVLGVALSRRPVHAFEPGETRAGESG